MPDNDSITEEAVEILRKAGCEENVIEHCLAVRSMALSIADRCRIPLDRDLLEKGAILHDLGRCRTHAITHVSEGARLARDYGLPVEIERIIERHIGAGLTADEAMTLGLPPRGYMPVTPEEKIVAHADNLIRGTEAISFEEALEDFIRKVGKNNPAVARFIALNAEIGSWMVPPGEK